MNTARPLTKISNGRIALLIVLGTESVFFATALMAYITLRGQVGWSVEHTLTRLAVPLVNTCILLLSAWIVWWSVGQIRTDRKAALRSGLMLSLWLGLFFVLGQIYEFNHAGLHINDLSFGGVFFTLLTFHAVHVLAGVIFLGLNLTRSMLGDFSSSDYEAVELGAWFWYYVTAVWLVLFTALYLI